MPRIAVPPPRYSGWAEALRVEVEETEAQPLEEKRYRVFVNGKEIGQVHSGHHARSRAALTWCVEDNTSPRIARPIRYDTRSGAIRDLIRGMP